MRYYLTLLSLLLFSHLSFGEVIEQKQEQKREEFRLSLKEVTIDSLAKIINERSNYHLYYRVAQNEESPLISLECDQSNFITLLTAALQREEYSLTVIGNSLYLLKGVGLMSSLPKGYFRGAKEDERSQYIDAITFDGKSAILENKLYVIGRENGAKEGTPTLIRGYVRNIESGEPIVGVSLFITSPNRATTTDNFGFYSLLLPKGSHTLEVRGYGLEDRALMVEINDAGELDVLMKDKVYTLKGVVLTAESTQKMRSTQIGLERVRIDRIKHIPAVFGEADVMKIVLTLPGVKSVGESSGGFNVRGGATDQNLILFNEGTIYNPTHLFGLFSSFNPDVVSDIELYKSTIPVKYGGRISSVLEINSRNGNSNKITGSAGVGLLTGKLHLEGPIGKRTTFIAGARTTYSNWILGMIPPESGYNDGKANFSDITVGVSHEIDESNRLYLYGYHSQDGFSFSADTSYNYQNSNIALKWRNIINQKHNLVVSGGVDNYSYQSQESGNLVEAYNLKFNIDQLFLKANFNWLLNEYHSLNYGVNSLYYRVEPGSLTPVDGASLVKPVILERERGAELSLYISDNWTIDDNLSLDLGVRYTLYSALGPRRWHRYGGDIIDESTVVEEIVSGKGALIKPYHGPEIRLSGRYSISDQLSLKGGFNTMRQNIHLLSNTTAIAPTDSWKLSDANIKPQQGWQAALGLYSNALKNRVELSLEGYYKKMNNYLDYKSGAKLIANHFIEREVINTNGRAYGVEFLAKKPLGKLNGWFSYTYSKTELRESGKKEFYNINRGEWYAAPYDKPHDLKLVGNYKFTQRFSLSFNLDYATGRPITIPIAKYYYGGGYRLYYSDRNQYRIPDYFRMDLSLNIEPSHNLTLFTHSTITLGVYNITGRKNAFSIFYDTDQGRGISGHKLSIFGAPIPFINYNIKF